MTDAAASTTQNNQQSSGQQSQSTSGDQGSGDGSQTTQQTVARPEWLPDTHWDPVANTIKPEFGQHYQELSTLKAAQDARLAARPKEPTGYELKFSDAFKPEVAIKFDESDPRLAPLRAYAHELNLDQAGFSKLLEIEAGRVISETKSYNAMVDAEKQKLGANGTQRVTALKTWLTGTLGAEAAVDLLGNDQQAGLVVFSEAAIKHLERLQLAMSNQGGASYSNGGREPPAAPEKTHAERMWPNGFGTPQARTS